MREIKHTITYRGLFLRDFVSLWCDELELKYMSKIKILSSHYLP